MDQAYVIDMIQRMVWLMLLLSAPILVVSLVVGMAISMLQAVTQIQESTITFVPKIVISMLVLVVMSPWLIGQMVEYTSQLFMELTVVAQKR
ncbi:MAG: flagellar biosynthesis protein FliQ [Candidatus Melainabacteria bacterium]